MKPNHRQSRRLTIEKMHEVAASRGGRCLSAVYVNNSTPLDWECSRGHTWSAVPAAVVKKKGTWCPTCPQRTGEQVTRAYFEQLFGKKFLSVQPDWIVNPKTGRKLQLDGYCEELKLAFEHQGVQHAKRSRRFHRSAKDLKEQLARDDFKRRQCRKHGVRLVLVPSIPDLLPYHGVKAFLKKELIDQGVPLPARFDEIEVDLGRVLTADRDADKLAELREIAASRGGRLLSERFYGSRELHRFECKLGHDWEAAAHAVRSGSWCLKCSRYLGRPKLGLSEYAEAGKPFGIQFLDSEVVGARHRHRWLCPKGHEFRAPIDAIRDGLGCRDCNGGVKTRTIVDMHTVAAERGGKCLSLRYFNAVTPLLWECSRGHRWKASPGSVLRNGSWCGDPACYGEKIGAKLRKGLDDLRKIAAGWGGRLVSGQYTHGDDKLQWICFQGHPFALEGAKVRQGAWCQICRRAMGGMKRRVGAGRATRKDLLALAKALGSRRFLK